MAAVTVDRRKHMTMGSYRAVVAQVDIAANNDTFNTGLKVVKSFQAQPNDSAAADVGGTLSGGTITFKVGGARNDVQILALGY